MKLPALADIRIGVIGLGYVGLPLAVYLSRHFPVIGFDIDAGRVDELSQGVDRTHEVTDAEFAAVKELSYTADIEALRGCNFYIVTVPTPVDNAKRPDLSALVAASRAVGQVIAPGDIVVYESTVYPGAVEEDCMPILERASGLVGGRDFNTAIRRSASIRATRRTVSKTTYALLSRGSVAHIRSQYPCDR